MTINVDPNSTPPVDPATLVTPTPTPTTPVEPAESAESTPPKKGTSGSAFYKSKVEELQRTNAEMKKMLDEQKTTQLKEKENYKELWEIEKTKRLSAEEKAVKISKDYLTGLKISAIETEALKAGILPKALADIRIEDASMVEIETGDRGSVSILGAKEYVEFLKETKDHWFTNSRAPIVNNRQGQPPAKPTELSSSDLIELEKKDPAKYKVEMKKRLGLA